MIDGYIAADNFLQCLDQLIKRCFLSTTDIKNSLATDLDLSETYAEYQNFNHC